ncbi:MAG: hypothetical protein NNA23_05405 [Nitrospira sp.]|nr:hypothetical protein [Nitrospira sp.]MCP9463178.1 hypothetical protein [Nitrospira sp.]
MSLNPDLIRARCAEIDLSLSWLEEIGRLPHETFLADHDTRDVGLLSIAHRHRGRTGPVLSGIPKRLHQAPEENDCIPCLKNMRAVSAR